MANVNRLAYHYQNVVRQDLLLKCSHSNIMDTPELCNINIVAQVAYDPKLVKQKRLALEIISGQKAVLYQPKATAKLKKNKIETFRLQSKSTRASQRRSASTSIYDSAPRGRSWSEGQANGRVRKDMLPKYYLRLCLRKAACSNFIEKLVSILCSTNNYVFGEARPYLKGSYAETYVEGPFGEARLREQAKKLSNVNNQLQALGISASSTLDQPVLLRRPVDSPLSVQATPQDFNIKIKGNIIELTLASLSLGPNGQATDRERPSTGVVGNILRHFPEIHHLQLSSLQFGAPAGAARSQSVSGSPSLTSATGGTWSVRTETNVPASVKTSDRQGPTLTKSEAREQRPGADRRPEPIGNQKTSLPFKEVVRPSDRAPIKRELTSKDQESLGLGGSFVDSFLSVKNLTIQIVTSAKNQEETCLVWTGLFQKEIYYDKSN